MAGLIFGCIAIISLERVLRTRAEARLEKGIEDLARLLSTDAQAGGVLSQRINALVDENAGSRLEGLEADISVLGTVVRQVAEAVADIEEAQHKLAPAPASEAHSAEDDGEEAAAMMLNAEPVVPIETLKQAMSENRLLFHVEPIVTLPQRRPHGYDLVPRLMLDDGELAEAADFMPRKGDDAVVRRIEGLAAQEAISIARRAQANGQTIILYVTLSHATLSDPLSVEQLAVSLEANRTIIPSIIGRIQASVWNEITLAEKLAIGTLARKGMVFSLFGAQSLRLDFNDLSAQGVRSVRIDATRFVDHPEKFTDIHTSDIVGYLRRSNIELMATGLRSEKQILSLLDDHIGLAQGPHIAGPGPVRADMTMAPALDSASRRA
jgi:cyclic-di-GMP phosphodiesterase TipF (flagellum assembly factor)